MDNKTKKIIICVMGIVVVLVGTFMLAMQLQKDDFIIGDKDYVFDENGNVPDEGMEPINETLSLGSIMQSVQENVVENLVAVEDEVANELLNLREYVGVEKMVARYVSNEEFTEIWLLKVSEEGQAPILFRIFNERINNLKTEYQGNENITRILNDYNNIRIKQQSGIVVIIVSNDAENIEKTIDANF